MANTFKVTSVSSVATTVGANTSTIYTCPAATTTVVLALLLSNKHSSSVDTSVQLVSATNNSGNNSNIGSNASAYIIKDVTIDENTSLELMAGQIYVLQVGDSVKVYAANTNIDVVFSYMEMT